MSLKNVKEYFVKTLFKQNEINNFNDTVINFKQSFKKEFILTQKEVNNIKYNKIGKNNKFDFIQLFHKID